MVHMHVIKSQNLWDKENQDWDCRDSSVVKSIIALPEDLNLILRMHVKWLTTSC